MKRTSALALATLLSVLFGSSAGAQCSDQVHYPPDPQPEHWFGQSVAIDGDRAVIGAMGDDDAADRAGAIYVAERDPGGAWSIVDQLYAGGAGPNQYFGREVALSGDRIAALADGTNTIHIFELAAGTWSETATIEAPAGYPPSDWFGNSLALQGDVLVIGDWGQSNGGTWGGVVHVFRAGAGTWSYEATLTRASAESQDRFGHEVDLDGDRIVAGVPGARTSPTERRGGANVFELAGGVWSEVAFLPGDGRHSFFGWSVGLSGDTIALGAPFGPVGGDNEGGAIVLELAGGVWTETAYFPSGTSTYTQYGEDVVLDGDRLAILAPSEAVIASPGFETLSVGVAHLARRGGGGWEEIGIVLGVVRGGLSGSLDLAGGELVAGEHGMELGVGVHVRPFGPSLVTPFCFCPDTEAGCHNEDPYAGCANATGSGALLSACGSTSVSADDLRLSVTGVVPKQFSILIMGRTVEGPSYLGNGRLCIGDPNAIRRFHVEQASMAGTLEYGPGIVAESLGFPPSGHILPGATWHFQTWYRDTGACMTGSNISSALAVTFSG